MSAGRSAEKYVKTFYAKKNGTPLDAIRKITEPMRLSAKVS
jgi:hypothetical protein